MLKLQQNIIAYPRGPPCLKHVKRGSQFVIKCVNIADWAGMQLVTTPHFNTSDEDHDDRLRNNE